MHHCDTHNTAVHIGDSQLSYRLPQCMTRQVSIVVLPLSPTALAAAASPLTVENLCHHNPTKQHAN